MTKEMEQLTCIVFASIISTDNEDYTEEVKQEMMRRYDEFKHCGNPDWAYILEPTGSDADKYLKLFGV